MMEWTIPQSTVAENKNKAEINYSTTEREALGMVFALQKYRHYLLANPFIFYTDHQALKYLINKPLHHGRICRWILLFQEFEFEVMVRPGKLNVEPNHLSWIDTGEEPIGVEDDLPDTPLQQNPVISVSFSFPFSIHYHFQCIFRHFLDKVDAFTWDGTFNGVICVPF